MWIPTIVPLGAITKWLSGGTPDRANEKYWAGSIPWISAASLKSLYINDSDQYLTAEAVQTGSKMAPIGATLVLVRGMALHREVRAGIAMRPVSFNQDVKALIPNTLVDPKYLVYAIHAQRAEVLGRVTSAGSGTGVLDTNTLKRLPIWLPDRAEQTLIVDILDDLEEQVGVLEKMMAKKQAIKQGMMQQLLTGKTRLPGFTLPWKDTRLGDHATYVKSVALSRAQLDEESPLRYLHYGDIHKSADVRLSAARARMPRATAELARLAGLLQVGDLVFADASEDPAGVGKSVEVTSVPPAGVVPGLHTIAARFDKSVLADGFKAYLQFIPDFRNSLLRLASGTKVLATTRSYISSVVVSLPAVEEQTAIAQVLCAADDELGALHHRLAKARSVKQGMMQELLTGRTRLREEVLL